MGLFGKKNKEEVFDEESAQHSEEAISTKKIRDKAKHGGKKKNKKDLMSNVFDESSPNVLNEFHDNKKCVVENNDGEELCVGLWFDVNDQEFGGFGQKARKSEDKGQIIQNIQNQYIQAYLPADLLEQEVMVIIPTITTLDNMLGYGILSNYTDDNGVSHERKYPICFLTNTNEIIKANDADVTLDEMMKVVSDSDEDSVESMLCEKEIPGFEEIEEDEEEEEPIQDVSMVSDDTDEIPVVPEMDDDIPVLDEDDMLGEEDPFKIDNASFIGQSEDGSQEVSEPVEDVNKVEDNEEEEPVEDEVIVEDVPVEIVQETLSRTFYPGDLDLEITTDAFDFAFLQDNNVLFFDEDRGEGWLNQYLSNMSKDANVSLARLHEQHLFTLRNEFIKYVSTHAETLYGQYGYNNADSVYSKKKIELDDAHNQNISSIDAQVDTVRADVVSDFDKRKQEAIERAKQDAARDFDDKYKSKIDWEVKTKEQEYRNKIDSEYRLQCETVNNSRREAALAEFEAGINTVLDHLSTRYAEMLQDENKLYHELGAEITRFMNNHCADEVEHDRVLARELEQSTRIDELTKTKQEELNTQAESYNIQAERLREEAKDANKRAKKTVKEAKEDCEKRINDVQYEKDKLQRQLDDLLDKYSELEDKKDKEYSARLDALRDQNASWADRYNGLEMSHKRAGWITTSLVAVSVVAALSVGMLVGTNMGLNNSGGKTNEQTVEEVQKKLDEVEKKYEEKEKELEEKTNYNKSSSDATSSNNTNNQSTTNNTTTDGAVTPQKVN